MAGMANALNPQRLDDLTQMLMRMSPQQRQQYAAQNRMDPTIVSMALYVNNIAKSAQNQQALQAAQSLQQQPKVVDAALAQMAPEEQGIGALAAPNMQGMADGGIAGYAEGDLVARSSPVVMMADGGVARYNGKDESLTGLPYADAPAAVAGVGIPVAVYRQAADLASRMGTSVSAILKQMGFDLAKAGGRGVAGATKLAASTPGAAVLAGGIPATQFATDVMAGSPELRQAYEDNPMMGAMDPNGALAAAILNQADSSGEKKLKKTPPSAATIAGNESGMDRRIQSGAPPSLDSISKVAPKPKGKPQGIAAAVPTPKQESSAAPAGGIADLFKASTAEEIGAEAEKLSKKDIERMNEEYRPFVEELKAEKAALGARKGDNINEALIRAGLSMMGGRSQNALQNIAAGATAGLDAYTAAQKADEAARRALRQSEMSIMQAQRAERSGYHKDAVALTNQARQEKQFAVTAAQKAEEIKNTKAWHDASAANQAIMAQASLQRANATGGNAEDKHRAFLLKVQTVLQGNPEYKKAAGFAASPGSVGDKARADMKRLEEETYRRLAPELLQSGQASPTSAGSGIDLSQWGKSQVVKP